MRKLGLLFFVWLLMIGAAQAGALQPLYKFQAMTLDGDKSAAYVREAIHRAAVARGWSAKPRNKSTLRLTFKKPGKVGQVYKIVLDARYSRRSINLRYVSSRDLDYNKEAGVISKRYNSWVRKLEKQIWKEVNRY